MRVPHHQIGQNREIYVFGNPAGVADREGVNRFWQDAAGILDTASAAEHGAASDIAILLDDRNGLRIVDAAGWSLDALRREYRAATAYTVKRTGTAVVVEADNGSEHCTLKRALPRTALTNLAGSIPFHLVRPEPALLTPSL